VIEGLVGADVSRRTADDRGQLGLVIDLARDRRVVLDRFVMADQRPVGLQGDPRPVRYRRLVSLVDMGHVIQRDGENRVRGRRRREVADLLEVVNLGRRRLDRAVLELMIQEGRK
jgi:hypothetical protein